MLPEILAKSGEAAKSGPIGLAVILILCILCYFLFKSMSKHLRTVRENHPADEDRPLQAEAETPVQRPESVALDPPGAEAEPPPAAQP